MPDQITADAPAGQRLRVQLLGQFCVSAGGRAAGPWPRPSARRLCELLLVSPGRRIRRDIACEALFGDRDQRAAARALSKALSMARAALGELGEDGSSLLGADLTHIWVAGPVEIDAEIQENALRAALAAGSDRTRQLRAALALADSQLLADEPDEEWARPPRERLAALRQEARLALARDLASGRGTVGSGPGPGAGDTGTGTGGTGTGTGGTGTGTGTTGTGTGTTGTGTTGTGGLRTTIPAPPGEDDVLLAWQSCLDYDPACEEAAGALARAYVARRSPERAARVLQRCRAALEELGLRLSPSLESVFAAAAAPAAPPVELPAPAPAQPPAAAEPGLARVTPREERRPVSVLFAEVAASRATAGSRDLEALRESVGGVLAAVMTEVEALGGTVTSVSGRGLQAMFGVPAAHEDDPERALRAAYRAVAVTSSPVTLSPVGPSAAEPSGGHAARDQPALRIGVESGPAVVGPLGGGARAEYAVFGDVVSVAAALQSAAGPGSVLVGPATRVATDHLFTWGAAEKVTPDLGGEPMAATYLDAPRASPGGRRPALGGTAPLAGRDAEMRVLAGALRELAGGHGSVVALTGEPGVGKTRLAQEGRRHFVAWAGAGTGRLPLWLEGRCSSYASGTPYGLYRQLLASWTGVSPDQPAALRMSALEGTLLRLTGNANLLPPLARMAGLPGPALADRSAGPAETQHMIFAAMRALVTRLTAIGPTVLVLEDLHWADPTSLHLTRHLAELASGRPLLLLVTARGEAAPDVASIAPEVRPIRLRPLPPAAARSLAGSLIGETAGDVLDAVVPPAGGNPLFLEERLSALLETGTLVREQGTWRLRDTADPQLSQVLERLVRSRIDRLSPPAQQAIRAASVLGFEFRAARLSAMLDGQPPEALESVLLELQASGLIHHRQPPGPEPAFVFRHALIQEAAYLGLLRAERRALHTRAATVIETAAQGAIPEVAAVLGRHYASAGETGRAIRFLEIAGDHATDAFANEEAISSFRTALGLTTGQDAMAEIVVGLQAKLANVLWRVARHAEATQAFRDALRVAADTGAVSALRQAHLYTRLGRVSMPEARFADAASSYDAAEALLGGEPGDQDDDTTVDHWLELMIDGRASLYGVLGRADRAEALLDKVGPLLRARGTPARKTEYYRLIAMAHLANNRMRPTDDDVELLRRSMTFSQQTGEAKDAAYAAHFLGFVLGLHGDLEEARAAHEKAVDMAERIGESVLLTGALTGLALIALHQRDLATARSAMARAATVAREGEHDEHSGGRADLWEKVAQVVLARLGQARAGQPDDLAGLFDELTQFIGTRPGTLDMRMTDVLYLARGLGSPGLGSPA